MLKEGLIPTPDRSMVPRFQDTKGNLRKMPEKIVIIGAGQAGGQAAQSLRSGGFEGTITLIGEEPHAPYQRPPLSKKYLMGEMDIDRIELKPKSFYKDNEIDLRLKTKADSIDRSAQTVALSTGEIIPYDKLILATGSCVRELNIPGAELPQVFYLRTIDDVDGIRGALKDGSRIAIIGGGYIGLEVAAVALKLGAEVTVVEMADRVMNRVVAPEISAFFEKLHKDAGVDLRVNAGVTKIIDQGGNVGGVECSDGSTIPADIVVIGVGILPGDELAKAAGLDINDGITVDHFAQTSDPNILAAGDCTNLPSELVGRRIRLESVQNAIDQAKTAANTILDKKKPYNEVPWFWSDQYDIKLQIAGLSFGYDQTVVRGNPDEKSFAVFYLKEGAIIAVDAVNAVPEFMIGKRLVGAHAKIDPARLADMSVSMKEMMQK